MIRWGVNAAALRQRCAPVGIRSSAASHAVRGLLLVTCKVLLASLLLSARASLRSRIHWCVVDQDHTKDIKKAGDAKQIGG